MSDITSQMLNNPMLQGLINNPELLRTVMRSNPAVSQVMQAVSIYKFVSCWEPLACLFWTKSISVPNASFFRKLHKEPSETIASCPIDLQTLCGCNIA